MFNDGTITLMAVDLVPGGGPHCARASLAMASLLPGTHAITVVYTGDGNFLTSTGNASQRVICTRNLTGTVSNLLLTSGSTCLEDGVVTGPVVVSTGARLFLKGTTIKGSVRSDSGGIVALCGDHIGGAVSITRVTGFVLIGGSSGAGCTGNSIGGATELSYNKSGIRIDGNQIVGTTIVRANSALGIDPVAGGYAAVVVLNNRLGGALQCSANSPAATGGATNAAAHYLGECV